MVKVLDDYLVHSCYICIFLFFGGFQTLGSWRAHGLPSLLLFGLWLSCCVVFCLFDAIVELGGMDGKSFTFSLEVKNGFYK